MGVKVYCKEKLMDALSKIQIGIYSFCMIRAGLV